VLLVWLLAALQSPVAGPPHDLTGYLAVAARYGSADHSAALREIQEWRTAEIDAAVAALPKAEKRLRAVPVRTSDIGFRTVEAAVLMHAEAGLFALLAQSPVDADTHLRASLGLFEWSRDAAGRLLKRASRSGEPALRVEPRIDRRDYSIALAAAALAMGFPCTARPFAEEAVRVAPLDAEVQLLSGCVNAGLAEDIALRYRASDGERLLEDARTAFRNALALDPGLREARLRLGKMRLDQGRSTEAEALLAEVDDRGADERQRYLARLFLGRVADRRGRRDEATRFYLLALQAWPDSQAARLALAQALERSSGPAAARPFVAASLAASARLARASDPWWLYAFGPPGLAKAALDRVWDRALDR
jgi:hypothetical protein